MQEMQVQSLGPEDPLEKERAIHSSILAWEIHGQRSLTRYSPRSHKIVGHNLALNTTTWSLYTWMDIWFISNLGADSTGRMCLLPCLWHLCTSLCKNTAYVFLLGESQGVEWLGHMIGAMFVQKVMLGKLFIWFKKPRS